MGDTRSVPNYIGNIGSSGPAYFNYDYIWAMAVSEQGSGFPEGKPWVIIAQPCTAQGGSGIILAHFASAADAQDALDGLMEQLGGAPTLRHAVLEP